VRTRRHPLPAQADCSRFSRRKGASAGSLEAGLVSLVEAAVYLSSRHGKLGTSMSTVSCKSDDEADN